MTDMVLQQIFEDVRTKSKIKCCRAAILEPRPVLHQVFEKGLVSHDIAGGKYRDFNAVYCTVVLFRVDCVIVVAGEGTSRHPHN